MKNRGYVKPYRCVHESGLNMYMEVQIRRTDNCTLWDLDKQCACLCLLDFFRTRSSTSCPLRKQISIRWRHTFVVDQVCVLGYKKCSWTHSFEKHGSPAEWPCCSVVAWYIIIQSNWSYIMINQHVYMMNSRFLIYSQEVFDRRAKMNERSVFNPMLHKEAWATRSRMLFWPGGSCSHQVPYMFKKENKHDVRRYEPPGTNSSVKLWKNELQSNIYKIESTDHEVIDHEVSRCTVSDHEVSDHEISKQHWLITINTSPLPLPCNGSRSERNMKISILATHVSRDDCRCFVSLNCQLFDLALHCLFHEILHITLPWEWHAGMISLHLCSYATST